MWNNIVYWNMLQREYMLHCIVWLISVVYLYVNLDPGMSLNCAPTRVCRKSASRPGYVVKVRPDPGYVVKQCPRISDE